MNLSNHPSKPDPVISSVGSGLGSFGGVFTPSILTILGVIMYLRFGWVVGNVGLWGALLVVTLSTSITLLTALSVSQIATDQRVRAGGAYYMISRSLGVETGGAVGIPLFFAQALSVALYTIGFAESLEAVLPFLNRRFVAVVTTVLVTALALRSARAAIKAQYVIMAAILLSLVSFYFGGPLDAPASADPPSRENFWVVLAVFFPAVTGIMAGVNMSGDLRDPRKAIPRGTLAAVGVSYLIYMTIPFFLNVWASPEQLISDALVMQRVAFWGPAILLGVWGATLSSALGSVLGAPRILQALARDGVLPSPLRFLGRGHGPEDEPRIGTFVTLGVALVAVLLGDLNVIAPVLTMFFLTTYGVLNVVASVETLLRSPSFRPTFRVPWWVSLLGALSCAAVMFLINAVATLVAVVTILLIFVWLERRGLQVAWGDVRQGLWMAVTRLGLYNIRDEADAKNWRPHMLVFSGAPNRRWHLVEFANALTHNRALLSVASIVTDASVTGERQTALTLAMREYLEERGVHAFSRVMSAADPFSGMETLVEAYGLGTLTPNTVVLGPGGNEHLARFALSIKRIYTAKRNVIILQTDPQRGLGERKRIDLWWGGLRGNGGLMMTLAYLLSTDLRWRNAELRVKMVVGEAASAEDALTNLETLLAGSRTGAKAEVLVGEFRELLLPNSAGADLVLLGLRSPADMSAEDYAAYYAALSEHTASLNAAAFVLAAEELEFGEILN